MEVTLKYKSKKVLLDLFYPHSWKPSNLVPGTPEYMRNHSWWLVFQSYFTN